MPNIGIQTEEVIIDNGEKFKNVTGTTVGTKRYLDVFTTGGAGIPNWDYLDVQQTSPTVETYVFKIGGSGGTTVRTIVITYTSSTKADIDTVEVS